MKPCRLLHCIRLSPRNGRSPIGIRSGLLLALIPAALHAQTTYTWNGSTSSAWNLASNWTPSTGFPLAGDNAVVVAAGIPPALDISRSLTHLTLNSGSLDLGGHVLTASGNGTFNSGTVDNGALVANSPSGTWHFGGTTFNASISGTASVLEFDDGVFNGTVDLTKTGTGNDYSTGNTTFNSTVVLTVTSGRLYLGHTGTTLFNDNVQLNSTGTSGGIWMGQNTGTLTLAAGRTVTTGTFNSGSLVMRNFTQAGTAPQSLGLTGTSTLYFQSGTTFNGNVVCVSAGLYMNGAVFNGSIRATKTGNTNEYSSGGTTYNGTADLSTTGAGILYLANTGSDQYNGDLILSSTGGGGFVFGNGGGTSTLQPGRTLSIGSAGFNNGRLQLRNFNISGADPVMLILGNNVAFTQHQGCVFGGNLTVTAGSIQLHGGTVNGDATYVKNDNTDDWGNGGCVFNGDLDLTNNGTGHFGPCNVGADIYNGDIRVSTTSTGSIRFGQSTGTATLAAGRTISVGAGGYTGSQFLLRRFVQLGNTPQTLVFGPTTRVYLRNDCAFGGDLTITGASYEISNCTFDGSCTLNMIGDLSDTSPGSNVFNGDLTINNTGTGDHFFSDSGDDLYNGNIVVSSTSGGDIRFGNSGGAPRLAAGRSLSIGSFDSGMLLLRNFRQLGSTPQTLTLASTARLYIADSTDFEADLTITTGQFQTRNATYRGAVHITKIGSTVDVSTGGNTFDQELELVNTTPGEIRFAENDTDRYQGNVRITNLDAGGIRFGNGGTGVAILADGRTISVGSGGFDAGVLLLRGFKQIGTTPQSIALGAAARLYFYPGCEFDGALTTTSGSILFWQSAFNSNVSSTKLGATGDASQGGCVFAGDLELINASSGNWYMGDSFSDAYHGDLILSNLVDGQLRFGNSGAATSTLEAGGTVRIGAGGFAGGTLLFRRFLQLGSEPMTLGLGTAARLYFQPGTEIGGPLSATAGDIYFNGAIFHREARFEKGGPGAATSDGGCTFHDAVEFVNTSTGYLSLNANLPDVFEGDIVLNNTSTGGFYFGNNIGSATLATGRTISVGSLGFDSGYLYLKSFTQLGTTPQSIQLGPAAMLVFNPGCEFNGALTTTSSRLLFYGSTFNGDAYFTKTGPAGDASSGGNTFNGRTEFLNTGSGNLSLAHLGGTDVYNADLVLNNTSNGQIAFGASTGTTVLAAGNTISIGALGFDAGSLRLRNFTQMGSTPQTLGIGDNATLEFSSGSTFGGNVTSTSGRLYFHGTTFHGVGDHTKTNNSGDGSVGNNIFHADVTFRLTTNGHLSLDQTGPDLFNGNIVLVNPGGGQFSFGSGTGTATLAAGRTISVAPGMFNSGTLVLKDFTQVGTTAQALMLGASATLYLQSGNTFNGDIVTSSGRIFLNGTTFNGTARFIKTGTSGDGSAGGNIFNDTVEFTVTSTGNFSLHHNTDDQFNGDILVNSTSSGRIAFGQAAGSATLAPGHTISVGGAGFASGDLLLRQFTQTGATSQHLLLGTSANLYFQTGTAFHGALTARAGDLFLNGAIYHAPSVFHKTGSSSNSCTGGGVFAADAELINTGSGIWYMANTGNDVYHGDLLLNSTGTGGIYFGNATGSTLVSTGALGIGATGLTAGTITFRNFTKQSSTATVLGGGVNSTLTFQTGSTFFGDLTTISGGLILSGSTFHGDVVMTKSGSGSNTSAGGNTFHGDVTINNNGQMSLGVSAVDDFNGNATFRRLGSGSFVVNHSFNTTFSRNVSTVGSVASVQFGAGAGRTIFDGTSPQTFSSDAAAPPLVRNLTLAMSGAGELILTGDVNVTLDLAFTSGIIKPQAVTSTSNGLLILANGITFSDPADGGSHVEGFVRKIGNQAFTFPVGGGGVLAPITMSAPTSSAHHFTARYVAESGHPSFPHTLKDASLDHLSLCEYWILDRTNSTTNVSVMLSWDTPRSCGVTDLAHLAVARWDGAQWRDHGGVASGTVSSGTITTSAPVSLFASPSPFTLASTNTSNPLPIELIDFTAVDEGPTVRTSWSTASEVNNDHFVVERSADGIAFVAMGSVSGSGSSQQVNHYDFVDGRPLEGTSYYRLQQVDLDGTFTYGPVVAVTRMSASSELHLWPNPADDEVNISVPGDLVSVRVHDAAGRMVFERTMGSGSGVINVDLRSVPSGVLLLTVITTDGTIRQQRILRR
ncbi:MAG: T9SS type A sorting domain-containing protein [Flavobacteriales bacterium]|nr:T9SS type A sorting domain-containing protein [Flavobacteriales bacterium]